MTVAPAIEAVDGALMVLEEFRATAGEMQRSIGRGGGS